MILEMFFRLTKKCVVSREREGKDEKTLQKMCL
jgi:hypothetical protein